MKKNAGDRGAELRLFEEVCRREGIKRTPQRIAIFTALAGRKDHPSAEDVYRLVKSKIPTISFDTVYRTLDLFAQCGLIRRVNHAGSKGRFDPNVHAHHHLVCVRCKRIVDFRWEALDKLPVPPAVRRWGRVQGKTLEIWGLCKECLEGGERKKK